MSQSLRLPSRLGPPVALGLGRGAVVTGSSAALGVAVALRPEVVLLVPLAFLWIAIVANWRRGVVALVVFLPFAGLPTFAFDTPFSPLLKDVAIVAPLYLSLWFALTRERRRIVPAGDRIVPWMLWLGGVALAFVAVSPSLLTAAIGLKVWLFCLPMYLIGYHFAESREDVIRLLRLTVAFGLVPTVIALGEVAYFARQGNFGPFTHLYGRFGDVIVQQVGLYQTIPRIPSTFTSAASYYNFALFALAAGLALWWYAPRRGLGVLVFVLGLAAITGGTRRAYFMVPLLLALPALRKRVHLSTRLRLLVGAVGVVALLAFLGVQVSGIAGRLGGAATSTATDLVDREILPTLANGLIGQGTGANTNAANRYGALTVAEGWKEGWYTKAFVEFGFPAALVAIALVLAVVRGAFVSVRGLDPATARLCLPLAVLLLATAVTLVKASELDWDPMNVYFFLTAGLIAGLARSRKDGIDP